MTCLFLGFYKKGQYPIANIGPQYLVFIILCVYVFFNIRFFALEISTAFSKGQSVFAVMLTCSVALNFFGFLHTAFGDAGYPPSLIYRENFKRFREEL